MAGVANKELAGLGVDDSVEGLAPPPNSPPAVDVEGAAVEADVVAVFWPKREPAVGVEVVVAAGVSAGFCPNSPTLGAEAGVEVVAAAGLLPNNELGVVDEPPAWVVG